MIYTESTYGSIVLFVYFYGLIGFRCNHASARHIKCYAEHTGFAVHRTRLNRRLQSLEIVPWNEKIIIFITFLQDWRENLLFESFAYNVHYPVLQSQRCMEPLSAPETKTPSALTARQLTIALWPDKFWMNFPSGHFHCLMLSGDAEANMYLGN